MEEKKIDMKAYHLGDMLIFCLGKDGRLDSWLDFDDFVARSLVGEVIEVSPDRIMVKLLDESVNSVISISPDDCQHVGFLSAVPNYLQQGRPCDA